MRYSISLRGMPVIRKASARGLGAMGIGRWHYDYWFKLIQAAVNGAPNIGRFELDGALAGAMAFDRKTSEPVKAKSLKSCTEALALFHLSPEDKFENGGPWDVWRTEWRHVSANRRQLIGKEANKVGDFVEHSFCSTSTLRYSKGRKGRNDAYKQSLRD